MMFAQNIPGKIPQATPAVTENIGIATPNLNA